MEEHFEYYFESRDLHLKYARSAPAVSGEEYHDYDELVLCLGGNVRFLSAQIQQTLSSGNLVVIPRGSFHQFAVSGEDYTRCIFGFSKTEELEGGLLFLLNDKAAGFITGVVLPIDGGFSAYSGV